MHGNNLSSEASKLSNLVNWEWKIQTNELWWSNSLYKIFGNISLPTLDAWLDRIHPDERENVKQSVRQVLEVKELEWTKEYRFLKQNNEYAFIIDKGFVIQDEAGKPVRLLGTMVDVSSHKEEQQQILDKNQELIKANEILDNFVYTVAHDLRSPVNNLTFLLEMVRQTQELEKKEKFIDMMHTAVSRLDQTINALIEVVQVQSDKTIEKKINFTDIFNLVMGDLNGALKQAGGIIKVNFDNAPQIRYVEAYLTSIMKNIISNAIKYRDLQRPLVIEITTHKSGKYVLMTLQDNGIGMDLTKHSNKLFKPFNRFTQQAEGKGIGLYLVKSMVEKNDGRIKVESKINAGTTFSIFLREYT